MIDPLLALRIMVATVAVLFGLIVGSFANVVIYRLPLEQSIVFPASRCPRCGAALRIWHNIPVLSWCFLRGKCAFCANPISARYPVVEAIHGVGFAMILLRFGIFPFTPLLLLLFSALVILAFIDWDHQILPDAITLPGIGIGIAGSLLRGSLVDWKESALTAILAYIGFLGVAKGYQRLRGIEGLGEGDWKLAAMMGAFLGGQRLLLIVFLGSLSGMIYGLWKAMSLRHESPGPSEQKPAIDPPAHLETASEALSAEPGTDANALTGVPGSVDNEDASSPSISAIGKYKLPFGTFLAAAAVLVLFFGCEILVWYSSFFRL